MIPECIAIKGFLSYDGTEQAITFDGGSLWLLSGPNGSGKSSVFDAMTFALFGAYRGGKQDLHEAINKGCDEASVQFDFRLDGHSYRIRRTLKRKRGGGATPAQQVFHLVPETNGTPASWEAVADTSKKSDLDKWVWEHLGLTFDSFTTSVLLVQGKADALLTADPRERHQVLARIIGMDDYERLHSRAADLARGFNTRADVLHSQLDGIAEVTELALVEAEQSITQADSALKTAHDELDCLRAVQTQAGEWARLQEAMEKLARQLTHAESMLQLEKEIEQAVARLQELRAMLPAMRRAMTHCEEKQRAAVELACLEKEKGHLADQLVAIDEAIRQASQKLQHAEITIDRQEKRRREVMEELQSLASAIPHLTILFKSREALRQAVEDAGKAEQDHRGAKNDAEAREAELTRIKGQLEPATLARVSGDEQKARMIARLEEIDRRIGRFDSVSGEKECSYCGQPLTTEHIQAERNLLAQQRKEAKAELDHAVLAQQAAATRERELLAQRDAKIAVASLIQQEIIAASRRQNSAEKDRKHSTAECDDAWAELSESIRRQISPLGSPDWLETTYPTRQDIDLLAQKQAGLKKEDGDLDREIKSCRKELESYRKDAKVGEDQRQQLTSRVAEQQTAIIKYQTLEETARKAFAVAIAELLPTWRDRAASATLAELSDWEAERDQLDRDGAEVKFQELDRARQTLQVLDRQREEIEREAAAVPTDARLPLDEVRQRITAAGKREKACNDELLRARGQEQHLRQRRADRQKLEDERKQAVGQGGLYGVLADCLGPDKLQRHVMHHAEEAIVCSASQILDRLSGGRLALRRKSDELTGRDKKALLLEAIKRDPAGEQVHPVDMLSGSERFRVAVSLALAIGEYASRQHRPIQSVIIDEGFGCLDPANSHLMIQELHNLQGHLKQIVLVSHQEEFASAFSNGYRFRLENGGTRVQRYPE